MIQERGIPESVEQFHIDKETVRKIITEDLEEKSCVRDLFPMRQR